MGTTDRVVVLIDMDCFYCQVEEKLDSNLDGKPIAVVQYNAWRGGGIIAVNYPARERGVTRHMRGNEAREKCPEIILARVPEVRGKADLTKYRDAGKRVADVLQTFTSVLERASIDEAYLDITEVVKKKLAEGSNQIKIENLQDTYVVGCETTDFIANLHENMEFTESNRMLAIGGMIVEGIRAEVLRKTGYKCSAGIAHNKVLAKLVCGLHKPNKQTVLPQEAIPELYKDLPIGKIKSLGGKFGNMLAEELQIKYMGELIRFSERELAKKFEEKNAKWLYNLARGIDMEPVTSRLVSKSIGCCKRFPGRTSLVTSESVEHWINELSAEMFERLEKDAEENNRRPKQMVVSFAQVTNKKNVNSSRTLPMNSYEQSRIAQDTLNVINKFCRKKDGSYGITFLGITVGNFQDVNKTSNIASFFKSMNDSNACKKELDELNPSSNRSQSEDEAQIDVCNQEIDSEKEADEINASIYSATTEDLDEDSKNYIYYEDIFPESVTSQPITDNAANDVTDTISNVSDNTEAISDVFQIRESSSKSFFIKHFENCTPVNDLIEEDIEDYEEEEAYTQAEKIKSSPEKISTTLNDEKLNESEDTTEICPKCRKKIPIQDIICHMDYHYSLEIVKSEAHLYNKRKVSVVPEKKVIDVKKPQAKSASSKRLKRNPEEVKSIETFLTNREELTNENSEFCIDCSKRIRLDELASHSDYHVAKKLHSEINLKHSQSSKVSKGRSVINSKDKKRKNSNISAFFNTYKDL